MHLRRFFQAPRFAGHLFVCFPLTFILGCGTAPIPNSLNASRPNTELVSSELAPVKSPVIEDATDHSAFEKAQAATLAINGSIIINGTIDSINDVDLYSLGPAKRGDRILIQVTGQNGLNTVAALFDGFTDLIDANDDRSFYGGLVDPSITRVVREDTGNLFLGITVSSSAHFASTQGRFDQGNYTVEIKREPNAPAPTARRQVVFIDFQGGRNVRIGLEPIETMRPFSAESISDRLDGSTEMIINLILDHMKQDFAAYDITLLDSRHDARPIGEHSELYFGNYNAQYLGLADNVDTDNAFLSQEAIIYAEDMALFESLQASAEEVALALANVGSHELGHLLGLEHSGNQSDLMATAASARQILEFDAGFLRSNMQSDVFPIGFQNEPAILMRNVGANPNAIGARMRLEDLLPKSNWNWRDEAGLADIPIVPCGRCGHADGLSAG